MKLQKHAWLHWLLGTCGLTAALLVVPLNFEHSAIASLSDSRRAEKQEPYTLMRAVAEDNTAFAIDLYHQFRQEEGNLFFSPFSVSTVLAMTYGGARGETAREMANVLHFDLPSSQLHQGFSYIFQSFEEYSPGSLKFANRLWLQKSLTAFDGFIALTRDRYGASLAKIDFSNTERSRQTINDWVAQRTNDRIQNAIPDDTIEENTQFILTNVIHFQAAWRNEFSKENTQNRPFYLGSDREVRVPTMYKKDKPATYLEDEDMQILQMYYADSLLSMIIFLPREVDGLPQLEAKLAPEFLLSRMEDLDRYLDNAIVDVFLPKFSIASEWKMKNTLQKMGMSQAFSKDSDFSGMSWDEFVLQEVVHKVFIAVDEEGTEAAGVTSSTGGTRGEPSYEEAVFRADRPFVFLIRDYNSGSILFMGRVTNPLE